MVSAIIWSIGGFIMNACILFILLNGSMWATDGCWVQNGWMAEPQDVVYTQRLPQLYTTQVFTPPPHWANSWRPYARSWRNWDGYRYSPRHNKRWRRHRRWLSGQRRWATRWTNDGRRHRHHHKRHHRRRHRHNHH